MSETTITQLPDPSGFSPDPLTEVLRSGARRLIEEAIEAELNTLLAAYADEKAEDGRARLVRHGHLPEREVMTGIGPVPVKVPRERDRGETGEKIRFASSILPPYLRKARSVEELLPWLYLKGISTGDFQEALAALLGPNAAGLSSTTISRLKADWSTDCERWQRRDLSARRFVYVWADGVYFQPRVAEEKQCVLVLIGADEWGRKEVLGLTDGYRESTQSWRELLLDLKRRGMAHAPDLAIGDGALGFWAALREVFGSAREQRCWVHKTGNVLNAMPKSVQAKAKGHLHDIWQAETKTEAEAAFDFFVETYGVKYDKAVAKLVKDRDVLLAFYDFPAEHWKHIRTSNPIESTFANVRHRTGKTKGCLSRKTGLAMAFKLMMSAQARWRKLDGANRMPEIVQGVEFKDGIKQLHQAA
ncbi:Transposase, Mutator family [Pseudoruegeria aquimaris]|uniref:Mutator family transposase n=1 Tax=Pseudoruegeria aquimaris TaxID=393663 RepID=A0A1Y5RLQ7_9RHOB|nr:IS256 family transposase [Pseudoruegeria aquimaris]SLN19345.1 Transposase, Mutator family [Pseudoruegeria aquimaris]